MKISKVLAAASAAALVASMGMTFVSADTSYTPTTMEVKDGVKKEKINNNVYKNAWDSLWVMCYDDALKDADLSKLAIHFVVEGQGTYEKGNVVFKLYDINGSKKVEDIVSYTAVEGQTKYDFYYNLKDIDLKGGNGFGFNTQAGHLPVKLVSATIEKVGESTPSSSAADVSSSTADATSSTVAGDSSKPADSSTDSKPAEPVTPPKQNTATDTVKDLEIGAGDTGYLADSNTLRLVADAKKGEYGYFASMDDLKKANVTAATFIINIDEAEIAKGSWIGGAVGTNCESTDWKGHEFTTQTFVLDKDGNYVDKDGDGLADRVKECTLTKIADGKYAYTLTNGGKTIFADTDTYAQLWMQDWSIKTMTLDKIILNPTTVYANPEQPKVGDVATSSTAATSSTVATSSTTSTNSTGTTSSKAANNASNTNPSTGAAALAAVGVALAGAAVVATKKRK
ncbi:NPXTG-anchored protein [uncultured Ruminococcus sp.]|uniref:NPXTG-anchored protein n=1 Tax=uncultured Ruminococcus sp. TaxID=165186 RepID=UPI0025D56E89|nr:NPXTG-anchored protein [uncultured Ruminococcus sp.]